MKLEKVAKTGSFLYDDHIRCPVRIVETDEPPHFGIEDEVREHPPSKTWFRVDLTAAGEPTRVSSAIVGFETLDEAIAHCEANGIELEE